MHHVIPLIFRTLPLLLNEALPSAAALVRRGRSYVVSGGNLGRFSCPSSSHRNWIRCCSLDLFDTRSNTTCWKAKDTKWSYHPDHPATREDREGFELWQGRVCCTMHHGLALLKTKWMRNFTDYPMGTRAKSPVASEGVRDVSHDLLFFVHHKTGTMLMHDFVRTLARFLGKREVRLSEVWESGRPETFMSFTEKEGQDSDDEDEAEFNATNLTDRKNVNVGRLGFFDNHGLSRSIHAYFLQPLVIHLVRRPSKIVISAYKYHLKGAETWLLRNNPPDCNQCDHFAWEQIFSRCSFACSYLEALSAASVAEGLQMEGLRSRWQILRMMEDVHRWQDEDYVLQLCLDDFHQAFTQTVLCVFHFALQVPVGSTLPVDPAPLLKAAEKHSAAQLQRCHKGNCTWQEMQSLRHMASSSDRKQLSEKLKELSYSIDQWTRQLYHADRLLERLMASSKNPALFGCPERPQLSTT